MLLDGSRRCGGCLCRRVVGLRPPKSCLLLSCCPCVSSYKAHPQHREGLPYLYIHRTVRWRIADLTWSLPLLAASRQAEAASQRGVPHNREHSYYETCYAVDSKRRGKVPESWSTYWAWKRMLVVSTPHMPQIIFSWIMSDPNRGGWMNTLHGQSTENPCFKVWQNPRLDQIALKFTYSKSSSIESAPHNEQCTPSNPEWARTHEGESDNT